MIYAIACASIPFLGMAGLYDCITAIDKISWEGVENLKNL